MTDSEGCAAYKAAGVVFFTQEAGQVRHVLLALEERRASAKQLGIAPEAGNEAPGKVSTDVVVFPQGRREKKDEGDPVETAMREYHEETGNFGALTEHLLRFYEDDAAEGADATRAVGASQPLTTAAAGQSFVMYFGLARMAVVFCEVPMDAYARSLRPLRKEDLVARMLPEASEHRSGGPAEAPEAVAPARKRQRGAGAASYRVGKEKHLTPVWVSAAALRAAVTPMDGEHGQRSARIEVTVCPRQSVDGTGHLGLSGGQACAAGVRRSVPFFPLNLSVFRQKEARSWLGLPEAEAGGGGRPSAAAPPGM